MSRRIQSFDFSRKNSSQRNNYYYFDKQYTPQNNQFDIGYKQKSSIYERSFMRNKQNQETFENQFLPSDVYELYSQEDKVRDVVQKIKEKQNMEIDQILFDLKEKIMQIINNKKEYLLEIIKQNWQGFDKLYLTFTQQVNSFLNDYNKQIQSQEDQYTEQLNMLKKQESYIQDPLQVQLKMVKLKKQRIQNKELLLNQINQSYQISQVPQLSIQIFQQLNSQNKILDNENIVFQISECCQYLKDNLNLIKQQNTIDDQFSRQSKVIKNSILNLNLSRNDSQKSGLKRRMKNSITVVSQRNIPQDYKQNLRERLKKIKFFNSNRIINTKNRFSNRKYDFNGSNNNKSIYLNPLKSKQIYLNSKNMNNENTSNEETLFSKNSFKNQLSKKQINFDRYYIENNSLTNFQVQSFCFIPQKKVYILSLKSQELILLDKNYQVQEKIELKFVISDIKLIQLETLLLVSEKDDKILRFDLNSFKVIFEYDTKNRKVNKVEVINNIYYFALLDNSPSPYFIFYEERQNN